MEALPGDGSRAGLARPLGGLSSRGSQFTAALVFADFDERPRPAGKPGKGWCHWCFIVAADGVAPVIDTGPLLVLPIAGAAAMPLLLLALLLLLPCHCCR